MKTQYYFKSCILLSVLLAAHIVLSQAIPPTTPNGTENYILVIEPVNGNTVADGQSPGIHTVQYFDGLGRPKQTIQSKGSPLGRDIILHHEYDGFGRQEKDYLPFPSNRVNGEILNSTTLKGNTENYYKIRYPCPDGTQCNLNPYSQKEIENSPLNRVTKQAAPGEDWKLGSGHEIKFDYQTNTGSDEVIIFTVNVTNGQLVKSKTINGTLQKFYPQASLYKTVTTDENNNKIEEYKNKQGQVVMKRTFSKTGTSEVLSRYDTYYVYDIYGNLAYVIPPKLLDLYFGNNTLPTDWKNKMILLGYQYRYDQRNRLIEKRLPGKGWERMVYDKQDRLVAVQDSLQKDQGYWLFTKYDKFGRVAYTGIVSNSSNRESLQLSVNNFGSNNEQRTASGFNQNGINIKYTKTAFPTTMGEVLSVNYYDYYDNIFDNRGIPEIVKPTQTVDERTIRAGLINSDAAHSIKGLLAASLVKIIGLNEWEYTYNFYDQKSRLTDAYKINNILGFTKTRHVLDFRGKVTATQTQHKRSNTSQDVILTLTDRYHYDDQERLLKHTHQINSSPEQLISLNRYDETGQLTTKGVGGTNLTGGPGRLQNVKYKYNIRGWLTDINNVDETLTGRGTDPSSNDDLFAFRISYNGLDFNGNDIMGPMASPLFNGNISETFWKTSSDNTLRGYGYVYDEINRLRHAQYLKPGALTPMPMNYDETLTYDKNGNIMTLKRKSGVDTPTGAMLTDNLSYTYLGNSNQLNKVTDATSSTTGFNNGTSGTSNDYTYDANGNMISDLNKGITEILYNHLNLPTNIYFANGNGIEYFYNAAGQKIRKKVYDMTAPPSGTIKDVDYLDGFQYAGGILQFFPTAEGYVSATFSAASLGGNTGTYLFNYVYNHTDHLGNIRLSYTKDPVSGEIEILEENHYYPFGLKHTAYSTGIKQKYELVENMENVARPGYVYQTDYQYKYNGKELQDELGLNLYDYGWRNYDPALGRWMNVDPLAEEFYGISPYNYVGNDPLNQADMDGRDFRIDVIRDKDDNITGLKFSGTVYIQGSGASKERAKELNTDFKDNYGGSVKVDGIDVSVDVNYVYDENKKQEDLGGDENLLRFSSEDKTSSVTGNIGNIYKSGESNNTIFHESFHFMGLSDRYDDYRNCPMCHRSYKTPANPGFENDIMGNGTALGKIHYQNWAKHAQMRAKSYLGPIKGSPFNPMSNRAESYIESSGIKKIDTNSKGQLQDKKGNWYKRIDYND